MSAVLVVRKRPRVLSHNLTIGNERLQEMTRIMAEERGGILYAIDERYCIDNGLMIAHAGLLQFKQGHQMPLEESTCTQR